LPASHSPKWGVAGAGWWGDGRVRCCCGCGCGWFCCGCCVAELWPRWCRASPPLPYLSLTGVVPSVAHFPSTKMGVAGGATGGTWGGTPLWLWLRLRHRRRGGGTQSGPPGGRTCGGKGRSTTFSLVGGGSSGGAGDNGVRHHQPTVQRRHVGVAVAWLAEAAADF
jgi:hypothetical protein